MSSGTFVDRIDPFAKRSLKKKPKKSQGSSRYRTGGDVELTALPLLKGKIRNDYECLDRINYLHQLELSHHSLYRHIVYKDCLSSS